MRIGGRDIRTIVGAIGQRRHYIALANMFRTYRSPAAALARYASAGGSYPCQISVRTPLGWIRPTLYSHHDLLTLNEVFCRLDYRTKEVARVVVDVGSNIGLSALYFLSRAGDVRCYLYEPVPENIARLEVNLAAFRDRAAVHQAAVSDTDGQVEFGVEVTGRYGGIGVATGRAIQVRCRSINQVLEDVLSREERIDLLKLDTEGAEERTVQAVLPKYFSRIGAVFLEGIPGRPLLPAPFVESRYGMVCRYVNPEVWRRS